MTKYKAKAVFTITITYFNCGLSPHAQTTKVEIVMKARAARHKITMARFL